MAQKDVFVEVTKPMWHAGICHGIGSVVKMKENEANLCKGRGRAKLSDAKAEKHMIFGHKAEAPKAEKK